MVQFVPGQHIHLVGIGGFGMSAIARVLLQQGYYITGSDRHANAFTQALEKEGARVFIGHNAQHVMGAEMVIATSAVPHDHEELAMARALGIPTYRRADIMAAMMSGQTGIAVAGTHGKTTTTAMITHILIETGQDPSYIIGGILRNTGRNGGTGKGRAFVVEADEYDNMFHGLRPQVAVVTSVEYDHPDFFATPGDMMKSFAKFVGLLPEDGLLVACADDSTAMILAQNRAVAGLPVVTYGIENPLASWQATNIGLDENRLTRFDVLREGEKTGTARLIPPGRHNILNALAALVVADHQAIPFQEAARALAAFQGTGRRFELRGEVGGVAVIDDYAHHPTAIKVTLEAARQRFPDRALWAVWQPHTYSRTHALLEDYIEAFGAADHVLVTDIYAAREAQSGISSADVVAIMRHPDVRHSGSLNDTARLLDAEVQPPAVIVIMSAGDAPLVGVNFLKSRQNRQGKTDEPPQDAAG